MLIFNKTKSKISKHWLQKKVNSILRSTGVKRIDFDLTLLGDRAIRTLNRQFRKKDKATDVLSFPLHEKKVARKGSIFLGDVVVSIPVTRRQAKEHGVSFEQELLFLIIHGVLHLLGYDHEKTESEARVMQKMEQKILVKVLKKK